ncbi:MAG: SufD family Fe-S cluster assembly protein [Sphingomonadales bacterium]|nr:SufD family Fe-S cluster assembly protein [Sphingomonadales bacterium]MDE2172267.1 SufD family Fe-S cluster assembly protein [Sphingomonadales bacterium]
MTVETLPTRAAEDWRYADVEALKALWPIAAPELVTVPAGGSFSRTILQTGGGVTRLSLVLESKATAVVHILNAGGPYARVEVDVLLHEGADFTLGGAQLAGEGETVEIVTTVTHAQPNATSRQLVRSVAAARGVASYLGKVKVERGADGTDGEQSVRAMLLDRTATANARPELEIYADSVKCAHGCAVGELDANGLFYLASRGVPPAQAKALMLSAFVAEAFDGAEEGDNLQAHAQALLEKALLEGKA